MKTVVSMILGGASWFILGQPEAWTVDFIRVLVLAACFGTIIALIPDERKRDD